MSKNKVLFLLECGSKDAQGLRAVAALADGHSVEVSGLFIEDEDLMKAAAVPGMVEVSIRSHQVTKLSYEGLQRALAQQAKEVREMFEHSAKSLNMRHNFKVTRGRMVETLLKTGASKDLVIIGRPLLAPGFRARTGVQFTALSDMQQDLLFINEPWETGSSIVVMLHENTDPAATVAKAQAIARKEKLPLVIAHTIDVDQQILALGDDSQPLSQIDDASLVELCAAYDARLLVMSAVDDINWQVLLTGLLNRLSCSLLRLG